MKDEMPKKERRMFFTVSKFLIQYTDYTSLCREISDKV